MEVGPPPDLRLRNERSNTKQLLGLELPEQRADDCQFCHWKAEPGGGPGIWVDPDHMGKIFPEPTTALLRQPTAGFSRCLLKTGYKSAEQTALL